MLGTESELVEATIKSPSAHFSETFPLFSPATRTDGFTPVHEVISRNQGSTNQLGNLLRRVINSPTGDCSPIDTRRRISSCTIDTKGHRNLDRKKRRDARTDGTVSGRRTSVEGPGWIQCESDWDDMRVPQSATCREDPSSDGQDLSVTMLRLGTCPQEEL
jgi:hypothetical protein